MLRFACLCTNRSLVRARWGAWSALLGFSWWTNTSYTCVPRADVSVAESKASHSAFRLVYMDSKELTCNCRENDSGYVVKAKAKLFNKIIFLSKGKFNVTIKILITHLQSRKYQNRNIQLLKWLHTVAFFLLNLFKINWKCMHNVNEHHLFFSTIL